MSLPALPTSAQATSGQRVNLRVLGVDALSVGHINPALVARPDAAANRLDVFAPDVVFLNPAARQRLADARLQPGIGEEGLPTDRFVFAGFAPSTKAARRSFLQDLAHQPATLVLYESPRRINQILEDLCDILGEGRKMALCRELTKRFEEVTRGTVAELAAIFAERDVKGEIVVLVDRAAVGATDAATWEDALDRAMQSMSVKDAAAMVAEAYDLPRREVYQVALSRGKVDRSD